MANSLPSSAHPTPALRAPAAPLRWMDNPDALGCWIVRKSIADGEQETWYDLIGTPEQGINYDAVDELCQLDPLPEAINVLRQQMITTIVVAAFFDSQFASDPADRAAAKTFLRNTLSDELDEVEYQGSGSM